MRSKKEKNIAAGQFKQQGGKGVSKVPPRYEWALAPWRVLAGRGRGCGTVRGRAVCRVCDGAPRRGAGGACFLGAGASANPAREPGHSRGSLALTALRPVCRGAARIRAARQTMPHPVAATGECSWCGDRALLYMRAKDGSEAERPACRPCVERGCGARPKQVGGAAEQRAGSGAENDHPMAMSASVFAPCEPQPALCSPAGRLPMAICAVHSSNEIVCKKRANGGAGIEGVGVAGMYQCGSIVAGGGVVADFDSGRSPYKRQRTALSSES